MKYNDIMPECFIDTTLVGSLLDANVSHKHSCNEVAREMEKGKYKDAFAVGIIDNDKRKLPYIEGFDTIGQTDNLTFLKHKDKHQYVIKVGKEHEAMETFIKANIEAIGMKMEDFDLPSDISKLIEQTKDSVSTQKDPRILKLCKTIRQSPEVAKLQDVLKYLSTNKYSADLETIKKMISR
ncbi:MAG: hypothetical protein E7102_02740 [Prevotella ruminicola]|jgi:hypothetical protein|uniref:Uncharacterized protein n=1 Tax=Xylanibacter ruminicola TaxID=839 RepID=A0A928BR94_XYLRU|nr:hypothetical protein [Xylanibacter ruminicola]